MFSIREAFPSDLDELAAIAVHLDTVNLPNDRGMLESILDVSQRSFAGELAPFEREYLFVLADHAAGRLVGTCMIHAQHGTRRSPHVFYEVLEDERYSETLDLHFVHQCLRIGWSYAGPTEIGGLILLPEYRGHAQGLGKLLSYVRFLYIGLHRDAFRDEILSELLPPLEPDGTSLLWESLGRHFTGLSYQEADRLSTHNKEFIRALFPQDLIYTTLLPKSVQAIIGQVGRNTRGVEKMLRAIGFTPAGRLDPFDGGPHFTARTADVTLVKGTRRVRVAADGGDGTTAGIVCAERPHPPHFVATGARFRMLPGDSIVLPEAARRVLDVAPADEVGCVPL
jgi:arginine N-succinyltransferase